MAGERWIVFLVLASLGGGIYIMTYLVDDESIEKYGKRVAEYNAQHHETVLDGALHRSKRRPIVDRWKEQASPLENDDDAGMVDHPYSENDRLMRARMNGGEDNGPDEEAARQRRSSGQGINEEDPNQEAARQRRSSGQGITEEDPDQEASRQRRSSGQGITEEDPDQEASRQRRSSGQGINEEDPNQEAARQRRSSGQGINEEDPNEEAARQRRSSGQGINEEDPNNDAVWQISSGQGDREDINPLLRHQALVADLLDSAEDVDGQEDQHTSLRNTRLLANHASDGSSSESESPEEYDHHETEENHFNPYEPADNRLGEELKRSNLLASESDGDKKLITFNKGIDFILGLMNSMFSLEGELSVPLPKLNKTFGHGIMQGQFEADRGFFKNPATLHRTGDVAIVKNGDSVGLEVALGLKTLEAGYDHYDLRILKIHQNGTLDVSVAENSVIMKISLTYYPHCKVDVNYLELNKLGGIKVDINGLGAFQSMVNMLSKWLTDNFTDDFRIIVNKKLIEKAKKAVAREDICKYFPLSLL